MRMLGFGQQGLGLINGRAYVNQHVPTLGHEPGGHGCAESLPRTGDEHNFVLHGLLTPTQFMKARIGLSGKTSDWLTRTPFLLTAWWAE